MTIGTLSEDRPAPGPLGGPGIAAVRPFALAAAAAALAGLLIGALVGVGVLLADGEFDWWFVQQSVLFAEAIGITAFICARWAEPQLGELPALPRYGLLIVTLFGGVLAATIISAWQRPGVLQGSRLLAFAGLVGAYLLLALLVAAVLIAWETLRRRLERALDELREKERIESEFKLAREVQLELLPDGPPRVDGLDIAFASLPAAVVGGDTLDFIDLGGGRLGVAVGDVLGKGFPAALVMANLQSLVRGLALREDDPARLNSILTRVIADRGTAGRFVTFAFVTIDVATGSLRYSLAGHHPPLIVGPAGVRRLGEGGLPLGIFRDAEYASGTDRLDRGEAMLIYTDGIVEAPAPDFDEPDAELDQYGTERLERLVVDHYGVSSDRLMDLILADVRQFSGHRPLADDTTLTVIRRPSAGVEA